MKRKIIIFIVIVLIFGAVAYFLKSKRNDVTPSLSARVPVEKQSVSAGGSNFARQAVTSSAVDGSTSYNSRFTVGKNRVWYKELPSSNVNATLNMSPIILPTQTGSNATGRYDLIRFIGLISSDIQQVAALLKQGNFTVQEWNLSKQATINDPTAPIAWRVHFDAPNGTISGIRKVVYKDNSRKNEVRSEGYYLNFFQGGYVIEQLGRNDGSEHLLFFANGQIKMYGRRLANMNYYGINYDEEGRVVSEKIEGLSPQEIASHKKLIKKYKNDPNMREGIRQLEAELQAMQTNK